MLKNFEFLALNCHNIRHSRNPVNFAEKVFVCMNSFPHGSGFDGEAKVVLEDSTQQKVVIRFEYRPLSENGYYLPWIEFRLTLHATLLPSRFISVLHAKQGKRWVLRKDSLADYLLDTLNEWLDSPISKDCSDLLAS